MVRKKRILYVLTGWPLYHSGGMIVYVTNLLKSLDSSKYDIYVFHNGELNLLFPIMYLKKRGNIYSLVNTHYYLDFELSPVKDVKIEYFFKKVLLEVNPDIIHFQDLGGLPFSLIEISKELTNAKIFNTFHNYYPICPRRELMHSDTSLCSLCIEGYICPDCQKQKKIIKIFLRVYINIFMRFLKSHSMNIMYQYLLKKSFSPSNTLHVYSTSLHDTTDKKVSERALYIRNILNNYVDMNLCVSYGVQKIFEQFGLDPKKSRVMHLGIDSDKLVQIKKEVFNDKTITFGFLGGASKHKGLYVLIHSFNILSQKYSDRIRLDIYGCSKPDYEEVLQEHVVNENILFHGSYTHDDLEKNLIKIDVGIVPSVWYDCAPLVVFEFLSAKIPVIGSDIGGIPDFIHNEKNGLLFEANNEADLIENMEKIINNPHIINEFKKNIKPVKTMSEHVKELIKIYQD